MATKCPRCGSTKTRKRGWEVLLNGRKQRRQCLNCKRHFFGRLQRQEQDVEYISRKPVSGEGGINKEVGSG